MMTPDFQIKLGGFKNAAARFQKEKDVLPPEITSKKDNFTKQTDVFVKKNEFWWNYI